MTIDKAIPAIVAVSCTLCLVLWFSGGEVRGLHERLPQVVAQPGKTAEKPPEPISVSGRLEKSDGVPADLPGSWPRFRGKNFDGISSEEPELARSWGPDGPPVLWSIAVGEGHAGAAVHNGRVYLMDYDEAARRDALRCLSLADGKEIWRFSYPVEIRRQYGMSRTVPAVTDKHVVAFGPKCHVTCVDATTGEFKWAYDLPREFGAEVPKWYAGQCPLIDGGRAIIAVGGSEVLMMAIDCETSKIVWRTPNPHNWKMTHSSVMPMEFGGRRIYVYCASGGAVGVSADDGRVLWTNTKWRVGFANVPSPVIPGAGRVFLTGGYGAGSMMLQLNEKDGAFATEEVFRLQQNVFGAEQHTPIYYRGHIYGVGVDGRLVCLDPSGRPVWVGGRTKTFRQGPYLIANGLIYVMNSSGVLTLAEATPSGYRELAEAKVLPGRCAYGPMAIAGGRLIVRDETTMTCLDVRRK